MYSKKTIYKKARNAGYAVEHGFQHYHSGEIVSNYRGERFTGYMVYDPTGYAVWGSYDQYYDHLWTLEDVENFIKGVYEENGLKY